MILHPQPSAGHLPHCPPFLQVCYCLTLEGNVSSRRPCPLRRAATQRNGTRSEQISVDSHSGEGTNLCSRSGLWGETTGAGGLQAMRTPSHLLPFLPTHSSPSLFLTFPLCTSPSLTPGLVSWVCSWERSPCPHMWICFSSRFPTNFQLLIPSFPRLLPQRLKVTTADTTEKRAAIGNDKWPFTTLPTCLLRIRY